MDGWIYNRYEVRWMVVSCGVVWCRVVSVMFVRACVWHKRYFFGGVRFARSRLISLASSYIPHKIQTCNTRTQYTPIQSRWKGRGG